ncbi:MAG TPA: ornithine carbamoyltransferase [Ktedonobacterales bacterium]|jgi:ornithine carbamoyltransferase|nr:ornithine carbamoyltransferase [Ktedonobacterales bacterium]
MASNGQEGKARLTMFDLLTLDDVTTAEMLDMFTQARLLKLGRASGAPVAQPLAGRTVALLFEKPSLRTRVSFEVAARELGATSLYLSWQEVGLGKREAVKDVARVLSSYVHAIVMRTFSQTIVEEMAQWASVPVINGLTDTHHPCQGLTDVYTIEEQLGGAQGKTLAYVGDGNNCACSLAQAAAKAGMHVRIATPAGYAPDPATLVSAQRDASRSGGSITVLQDPNEAVDGADAIYTDVWASMGQEAELEARRATFAPYQVNADLVALAAPHAIILHPLPAHRGDEVTDDVLDGSRSRVFDQAENRLHIQKAILRTALATHGAKREPALSA